MITEYMRKKWISLSMNNHLESMNKRKKYMMYPYMVIAAYILITLILNLFGPVEYQGYTTGKKAAVTIYILMFLVVTYVGMKIASMSGQVKDAALNKNYARVKNFIFIIEITIVVVFLIKLSLIIYQVIQYGIPVSGMSFSSMAEVYSDLHLTESDVNIFRKINSFTRVLTFLAFFSGMYMWKKISRSGRIMLCAAIILDFLYNILYIGTQRSLFTYMVLAGMLYIVHVIKSGKGIKKRNVFFVAVAVVGAVLIFTKIISARFTLWGSVMSTDFRNGMKFNPNHILVQWLPDEMKYAFITLLSYPSQGYYGLSMCFDVPFQWTWFLGGARGLNSIASQVLSEIPDFLSSTYPVRTGEMIGFDGLAAWYTIFAWLAGDVTFLGALVVMLLAAYLFMRCWKEVILYNNPLSFAMLIQLVIMYVFVPANNQLFVDRGDSLGIIFLFIIWLVFHKRLNYCEEMN